MKKKTFKIPIYFGKLVVIKTKNLEKVIKKHKLDCDANLCDAFVFKKTNKKGVLSFYAVFRKASPQIIAHESVHIVNDIFYEGNIGLDSRNDEPQAYLTGWVFNKITKAIKK